MFTKINYTFLQFENVRRVFLKLFTTQYQLKVLLINDIISSNYFVILIDTFQLFSKFIKYSWINNIDYLNEHLVNECSDLFTNSVQKYIQVCNYN